MSGVELDMKIENQGPYAIESDGKTVWVNNMMGWCVARFGHTGYDFNNLANMMGSAKGSGPGGFTDLKDWTGFVRTVRSLYNVMVGDMHKPDRLAAY